MLACDTPVFQGVYAPTWLQALGTGADNVHLPVTGLYVFAIFYYNKIKLLFSLLLLFK